MVRRVSVTITTAADGSATSYTEPISGRVLAIRYVPHASTPLDANADVTITEHATGIALLTITNVGTSAVTYYPRAATVSVANAAALYASGGTAINTEIPVADDAIKFVVASGDDTKTGTFYVLYE